MKKSSINPFKNLMNRKIASHKPDSVSNSLELCHLSGSAVTDEIYLPTPWRWTSSPHPTESGTNIHGIAPHRVYLVPLQPYCTCFLLHLSSLGSAERTGVTRYAALWCPDFPPSAVTESDKVACCYKDRDLGIKFRTRQKLYMVEITLTT